MCNYASCPLINAASDDDHNGTDRPANLRSVIESSLQDLAKKEEASLSATLNAKDAITNELKTLGEKVTSQNAIFDQWEKLEQEATFQR